MLIDDYEVTDFLGSGGMGTVLLVKTQKGQRFAIKMIGPEAAVRAALTGKSPTPNRIALDLRRRMMLVREARLAMGLRHSNIVHTRGYGQHQGLLYLVLEYLEGRSLDKVIPLQRAIPLPEKLNMVGQICDALEYAHDHGVVHRDIKPANIFVLADQSIKVLDFGLATHLTAAIAGRAGTYGTPQYIAPELINGSAACDARIDVWSTGVTLYQLLTGALLFVGRTQGELFNNITKKDFPPLDTQIPYAESLEHILSKALAKNPANRYRFASEMARDLRQISADREGVDRSSQAGAVPQATPVWWASTVVRALSYNGADFKPPQSTISMVSGRISPLFGGFTDKFIRYNRLVLSVAMWGVLGMFFAAFLALLLISLYAAEPTVSLSRAWADLPWVFGLVGFTVTAVGIGLGILSSCEKFCEIPRCKSCRCWMKHTCRIDRFSYTDQSRRHAASDCIAALREDLWEDAGRLLELHGQWFLPQKKAPGGIVRYHLDFFACSICGDEYATFLSESPDGRLSEPLEGVHGAYKAVDGHDRGVTILHRARLLFRACKRAVFLTSESVDPAIAIVLFIATIGFGWLGTRRLLNQMNVFEYKTAIQIISSPADEAILVDGSAVVTPKVFYWRFGSVHTIGGFGDRQIGKVPYRFQWVLGSNPTYFSHDSEVCRASELRVPIECRITVTKAQDQSGSVNRPLNSLYKVQFLDAYTIKNLYELQTPISNSIDQGLILPRNAQDFDEAAIFPLR